MRVRSVRATMLVITLGCGSFLFQGCPVGGLLTDCFGSGTISRSEYEDLNALERLMYEENSCGRYTRQSNIFSSLFD